MFGKRVLVLFSVITAFAVHDARAVPIPIGGLPTGVSGTIDDEISNFTLTLSGGPITADAVAGPLTPNIPGGNWPITFTLIIDDQSGDATPGPDSVVLSGNIFHDAEPHPPEGNGGVLNFSFVALAVPGGATVTFDGDVENLNNMKFEQHKFHRDRYDGAIQRIVSGNQIVSWSLSLEARHIPEPSTLALFGVGVLCFLGFRGRLKSS